MKKGLSVPPTKSVLLQIRRQVRFLEQGQQMLEKKRDLLTRLIYERLAVYRKLRAQAAEELKRAYYWLGIVQMRMGSQMLRQTAVGLQPAVNLKITARSSVGVEYPSVSASPLPLQPVGLMWTDVSFDEARLRLRELILTLAQLGEAENALWRLPGRQPQDAQAGQRAQVQHHPALSDYAAAYSPGAGRRREKYAIPGEAAAGSANSGIG